MSFDLGDYNDVESRIREFRAKHPDGSLRPLDPTRPYSIETIGDKTFVVVAIAAFRTPDDPAPGVGLAWEPVPGRTPYTKDSELMNAETSARGRAIVAAGAADARGASRDDVENARAAQAAEAELLEVKRELKAAWESKGWDLPTGQSDYQSWSGGEPATAATAEGLRRYLSNLAVAS